MRFEDLPTTPRAEELLDTAFSRASRAGRAKSGHDAQTSMLTTAGNVLADNLANVVRQWPDFDGLDRFQYELADAVLAGTDVGGVDALRQHLSRVGWAGRQTASIRDEYQGRMRSVDATAARKLRKQAFARLADVTESVAADLRAIGTARDALRQLPEIHADSPTIVVAGYPNVGKSTFVNRVTNARNEVAAYPFTTRQLRVGHLDREHVRYQLVDTPGLLDRPAAERNEIEQQAVSALTHLADCVLVLIDASETCGYPLADQRGLLAELRTRFDVPVLAIASKSDLSSDVAADAAMSVQTGTGVEEVLTAAIAAIGHEPTLPFEE